MSTPIACPKCNATFEITEVMTNQLRERMRTEINLELAPERKRLQDEATKLAGEKAALVEQRRTIQDQVNQLVAAEREKLVGQARASAVAEVAIELKDRDDRISEAQSRLKAAESRELEWRKKEREFAEREESLQRMQEEQAENNKRTLAAERHKLMEEGRRKAADELSAPLRERDEQLQELREKLKVAAEQESAFRKREREVESRAEQLQLEVGRLVAAERQQIRDTAKEQSREEFELKLRDEHEKNESLRKQIDELKRRAEQGSQQAQGETLELVVDEMIVDAFRTDRVEEVKTGAHGADIHQHVLGANGSECGMVLWETKRAKNWQSDWLEKAKRDQHEAGAAVAIIVTEVLPPGIVNFGIVEDVWVCRRACAIPLATALRSGMLALAGARRALEGQHGKMEALYNYLSSPTFLNRVNATLEPLVRMKADLASEKRAIQGRWKRREKQIDQATFGTAGMYGELQGIIGGALPEIELLRLDDLSDDLATKRLPLENDADEASDDCLAAPQVNGNVNSTLAEESQDWI